MNQLGLLPVLHAAFGEIREDLSTSQDSFDIPVDYAFEQGVAAISLDGWQKLYDNHYDLIAPFGVNVYLNRDLFAQTLLIENEYSEQWKNAQLFAEEMEEQNVRVFVLKGFAISRLYPIPEHRPCCDMDCFLLSEGKPAYDIGNWIAFKSGCSVNAHYYKHSKIKVGSLIIENHQFCLPVKGDRRSKELNAFLLSIIDDGELRHIGKSKLLAPSPMFNAIYVLAHAREHFFNERITLRHICDWGCLIRSLSDAGDAFWDEWRRHCSKFSLLEFGYSMSRLARTVCGFPIPFLCPENDALDKRVLEDILKPSVKKKNGFSRRIQLVGNLLSSRWKFKAFSNRSAFGFALRRIWGYLVEKDPE